MNLCERQASSILQARWPWTGCPARERGSVNQVKRGGCYGPSSRLRPEVFLCEKMAAGGLIKVNFERVAIPALCLEFELELHAFPAVLCLDLVLVTVDLGASPPGTDQLLMEVLVDVMQARIARKCALRVFPATALARNDRTRVRHEIEVRVQRIDGGLVAGRSVSAAGVHLELRCSRRPVLLREGANDDRQGAGESLISKLGGGEEVALVVERSQ